MSKSQNSTVLFDALGPRGRTRVFTSSVVSGIVLLAILALAALQLSKEGFFEQSRWVNPLDALVVEKTWIPALLNTLKAAGLGCVGALILGTLVGFGRISRLPILRVLSAVYVQFFRAMPALLLIWIPYTVMNRLQHPYDGFYYVVIGLSVYNGAVLAEILRSGINALPAGQAMAGKAIGLRHGQVLRLIVLPQAFRNMLPAVLAQLVILLKDVALGYIVTYPELLHEGEGIANFYGNSYLQALIIAAAFYFVIAYVLTKLISLLEKRLRRKATTGKSTGRVAEMEQAAAAAA